MALQARNTYDYGVLRQPLHRLRIGFWEIFWKLKHPKLNSTYACFTNKLFYFKIISVASLIRRINALIGKYSIFITTSISEFMIIFDEGLASSDEKCPDIIFSQECPKCPGILFLQESILGYENIFRNLIFSSFIQSNTHFKASPSTPIAGCNY